MPSSWRCRRRSASSCKYLSTNTQSTSPQPFEECSGMDPCIWIASNMKALSLIAEGDFISFDQIGNHFFPYDQEKSAQMACKLKKKFSKKACLKRASSGSAEPLVLEDGINAVSIPSGVQQNGITLTQFQSYLSKKIASGLRKQKMFAIAKGTGAYTANVPIAILSWTTLLCFDVCAFVVCTLTFQQIFRIKGLKDKVHDINDKHIPYVTKKVHKYGKTNFRLSKRLNAQVCALKRMEVK